MWGCAAAAPAGPGPASEQDGARSPGWGRHTSPGQLLWGGGRGMEGWRVGGTEAEREHMVAVCLLGSEQV